MKRYGLIGYPLTHSFSQKYFTEKFSREQIEYCRYENFPLTDINAFQSLIEKEKDLAGLNVTIPYKETVMPFLDALDETAREIGAVNTIRFTAEGLVGYNTDAYGFMQAIMPMLQPHHNSALILGTGGSSKAVSWSLRKMGITYKFVSRNPSSTDEISYQQANNEIRENKILINTTPLGMFPLVDDAPAIAYEAITPLHILFDLVYNPEETLFLKKGKARQAGTQNGLKMLQLQAEKSWQTWNT